MLFVLFRVSYHNPIQSMHMSIPRARSSSISKSFWLAFIDKYSAVTEYRFDARMERLPSCELIVFCRDTGTNEDPDEVDAREGVCRRVVAMVSSRPVGGVDIQ